MIGEVISQYKIIKEIGHGGMGNVYLAEDTKLNRFVALKFLSPELTRDSEAKKRFLREARAASSLDHPNICTIHEINETKDGQLFLCMAYYEGESLKDKINHGPVKPEDAIDLILQVCRGLKSAHNKGLIHRDIKPANILITKDGITKIIDFGLAKLSGQAKITKDHTTIGTLAYLSPEQASGKEVNNRTDIWAVGVILYEMLTGQLPFKGEADQVMIYSILHEDFASPASINPSVPSELEKIIDICLQKEPANRYQNIENLEKDLKKLKDEKVTEDDSGKSRKRVTHISKSTKVGVVLLAILVSLISYLIIRQNMQKVATGRKSIPIAVIGFKNLTGIDAYDYLQEAIPNLLITNLEQSPFLYITTWERMYDLLNQMDTSGINFIDKEIGFELGRRDEIDMIVTGSFTKADDLFITDIKVLDVYTKEIIKSATSSGSGVSSIIKHQIDELSKEIARGIGLSKSKIKTMRTELSDVTTNSMEAYRCFINGREKFEKSYWEDAILLLQKAVELDSTFSMAYLYLARSFWNIYHGTEGGQAYEQALKYAYRATEKERLYIEESKYYYNDEKKYNTLKELTEKYPKEKRALFIMGEYYLSNKLLEKAATSFNRALELDPDYESALQQLAHTYMNMGDYDRALEIQKRYIEIFSGDAKPLVGLGDILFHMGKLDEAIVNYGEALRIKPDFYYAYLKISYCYGLKSDYRQSIQWIEKYEQHAQSEGPKAEVMWWKAYYLKWLGQFGSSLYESNNIIQLAQNLNEESGIAMAKFLIASIYYENKEFQESRLYYKDAFDIFPRYSDTLFYKQCHNFFRGIIFLNEEQMDSTRKLVNEIQSTIPAIKMQIPWREEPLQILGQILEAEYILAIGKAQEAVALAKEISVEQIPVIPSMDFLFYNLPLHDDILARAYIKSGNSEKAIQEYERLTNFNPESKDRRLIYPLYHYKLAKLYQEKGLNDRARNQYKTFLRLWKHADSDRLELNEAKKQLELLKIN